MADFASVVYKITIAAGISIARDLFSLRPPPALHVLECTFCLLERWDHVGLSSPHWRWYWNDRAGAEIDYEGKTIPLSPTHAILVPPNVAFTTRTHRPVGHLYCHFWLGLHLAKDDAHPAVVRLKQDARNSLVALARQARAARLDVARSPATWLTVLSHITGSLSRTPYAWEARDADPLVDRVRHRLYEASGASSPDNADLAAEVGLSVNTLLRRFRAATGTTPKKFQLQLRIARAAQMLRSGNLTISEIAQRCGFVDRYHLTRVFSDQAGIGPAAFRSAGSRAI